MTTFEATELSHPRPDRLLPENFVTALAVSAALWLLPVIVLMIASHF